VGEERQIQHFQTIFIDYDETKKRKIFTHRETGKKARNFGFFVDFSSANRRHL
jgi:hypothetical protein